MNRSLRSAVSLTLCALTLASGCTPTQPFYFHEDGNLSHYKEVATEIEYPNVNTETIDEVTNARAPLTLANAQNFEMWDLSLEEVTRITLQNSNVIRQLGGRVNDGGQNITQFTPQTISQAPGQVTTTYDVALTDSAYGGNTGSQFSGTGVEAALAEFDAQLDSSITWQNNDRPQNFGLATLPNFFNPLFRQHLAQYTTGITKATATGAIFEVRNNINYDQNNNGSRTQPSDWFANVETAATVPLLQGAGTEYNRIAGPRTFQEQAQGFADQIDGVIIARLRTDVTLTQFEVGVRNLMRDVETAYWELYFCYRDLEARKIGYASSLAAWRKVNARARVGGEGGEANAEAQARSQVFLFQSQMETALTNLFRVENKLRYLMGLTATDTRLIRPSDEPTTAQVHFDWSTINSEALARREELRQQRWTIKRRELELVAAKNQLLPRLDAVGRYRWLGAGDDLINSSRTGLQPFADGSNAFESLTSGRFQEWQAGLQFSMPLGMRRGMAEVRNHEQLLARDRAVMQELELEISHQLADAKRDVDLNYGVAQTNFNRRAAADDEVNAVTALYDAGRITLDQVLDAQRRQSDAESAFYRSLVDYNRAIMLLHYNKGSLLEYNAVYLQEGPWPGKAYFDAMRRARQRDGGLKLDYGFTRPKVISRGPVPQETGTSSGGVFNGPVVGGQQAQPGPAAPPAGSPPAQEVIPTPSEPLSAIPGVVSTANYVEQLPLAAPMAAVAPLNAAPAPNAAPTMALVPTTPNNPFPRESGVSISAPGLPPSTPVPAVSNPFTASPAGGPAAGGTTFVQPVAYEPQANHPPVDAAANLAADSAK
jgi:outer membrane protein TolC